MNPKYHRGFRGRDNVVVGFTTTITLTTRKLRPLLELFVDVTIQANNNYYTLL
jgi:hypothetical protein